MVIGWETALNSQKEFLQIVMSWWYLRPLQVGLDTDRITTGWVDPDTPK